MACERYVELSQCHELLTTLIGECLHIGNRNLWTDAASSLHEKDKTSLSLSDPAPKLDDLLGIVSNAREEYQRKQWRVHISAKNEVIILQDVFSKIAVWIKKFVEVGDTAMQYDTGHAALPWAAVRVLLTASTSNIEKAKLVIEGIEQICNLITWCNVQERIYLHPGYYTTAQLQVALTKLYGAILVFLAKAIRFYRKSTVGGCNSLLGARTVDPLFIMILLTTLLTRDCISALQLERSRDLHRRATSSASF